MSNKEWQKASDALKQLVDVEPSRWEYFQNLGTARLNLGQYNDSIQTFDKSISLAQDQLKPANPGASETTKIKTALGQMFTNEGNAYLKLRNNEKAIAMYSRAAELDPNPATAYFNLCAVQYNMGNVDGAIAACTKTIAADPNKADAYFIKASAMYGNGTMDPKGKFIVPPGTVDALKKYLALAPQGAHVADVKAMLEALDIK